MKIEKLMPDSAVIIEGLVSKGISEKTIEAAEVIIHEALVSYLEYQANENKAVGFLGLDELDRLKEVCKDKLRFSGHKMRFIETRNADSSEIDSLIRELAYEEDATLMTADHVLARVAKAKGIKTYFSEKLTKKKKMEIEKFFDITTMSVHLKENVLPYAKKGLPGAWTFEAVRNKKLTQEEIKEISREIIEEANIREDGFLEIERPCSTIVQLGLYRIVITKPPFSDGWEITAVRPVKKLKLEEYKISEKLMERITKQAEGILIAGSPGMGKTTFAAALAEYYADKNKIVKTVEAPRDLVLPDSITQYAISQGDAQEIHDILLLSRPDYTFFDEMRNTNDFRLFADLRLAGIGFIGVVHATKPIDAIQRFVGRIELGVIPQVIDTVIFIKNGEINKVLSLKMMVKVPSGMTEADLARPIVVVNDFETNSLEFELYCYGEETVVVPVSGEARHGGIRDLAAMQIQKFFSRYTDNSKVEILSDNKCKVYVPEQYIAKIIGKQGKNIAELEQQLGVSIDIEELSKSQQTSAESIPYHAQIGNKNIVFELSNGYQGRDVNLVVNGEYLLTAKVGKNNIIKIKKNNKIGNIIVNCINAKETVEIKALE